jgi:uncharacterized protein (TIGR03435 family)
MRVALFLVAGLTAQLAVRAQEPASPHKFEVASIKPAVAGEHPPEGNSPDGRINWVQTVHGLILMSYKLQEYQLAGEPKWANAEQYLITAKPPEGPLPADQRERTDRISEMLRYLLEDRFQLRVHHETRTVQEYELVAVKGGSKLQEVKRGDTPFRLQMGPGKIATKGGAGIGLLAQLLTTRLGCPVIDQTGLSRELLFDIQLNYAPDDKPSDTVPPLFTALQEQLGLRLQATKGPVDVVVVDRVERPSAN